MDLVSLVLESLANLTMLVTKPFSLITLLCIFGVRSFCIVILTWLELLRAAVSFHVNIIWKIMHWTSSLICLPVQVLTALRRERPLQMHLHELQNLQWNRMELKQHLQMSIKECRMMEAMLEELEDEHDQAVVKIELLKSELQVMKQENLRLKEIQGKGLWSYRSKDDMGEGNDHHDAAADKCSISYGIQQWESSFKELKSIGPTHAVSPGIMSRNLDENEVFGQHREVALFQSIFSMVLSLLVAAIIWEAEDPCVPLVVALFTVVSLSLKSVLQFFSIIKNKPAYEAVALLSCNWFMLGALAFPALPRIARMLIPMALSFWRWTFGWLGFPY